LRPLHRYRKLNIRGKIRIYEGKYRYIVQIDIVWYIFETRFETKNFTSWTKATRLRIYFRNLSVHRSFLQYKSQCLEKVKVKYVNQHIATKYVIISHIFVHFLYNNKFSIDFATAKLYSPLPANSYIIIFLSHILHWPFPSIDFYIAKKIFERTNCEK
jgi:hypothetical protein